MANYLDETGLNQYTQALKNGSLKVGKSVEADSVNAENIQGIIPLSKVPKAALDRLYKVANQEAMLNLTLGDIQEGDSVQVLDTKVMYLFTDESKIGTMDAFTEYSAGIAAHATSADSADNAQNAVHATNADNATNANSADSVAWAGIIGKPSQYPSEDKAIPASVISSIIKGTYE